MNFNPVWVIKSTCQDMKIQDTSGNDLLKNISKRFSMTA